MNVATMKVDGLTARAKWIEYRRAVRANPQANDEILMKGYREIARGRKVLDLNSVIKAGGVDSLLRPRLAIARADSKRCNFWYEDFRPVFSHFTRTYGKERRARDRHFVLPHRLFDVGTHTALSQVRAYAQVPMIPPSLRPAHAIEGYHILWEANWEAPPTDPLLLKHIAGPLFAILAQWDLTDLERAVMAGSLG